MSDRRPSHLSLNKKEMKAYGYKIVDILVEHFDTMHEKPVAKFGDREEVCARFEEKLPHQPSSPDEVLDHVIRDVLGNVNLLSHPRFFSFVPSPSNFISAMSDTLATGFNTFSGSWAGAPTAAALEIITINWLLELFGFPVQEGGGIFTSGGSMANLTALVTARHEKCGENFSDACIYLSDQAHSSNIKAIRVLGFHKNQIRIIPTDGEYKISINKLKNCIAKDIIQGKTPFCVIASAGTTNTGTIDPLVEIAKIAQKHEMWMHVDAAYGGGAILSKRGKELLAGIELADSITVDPHKWFFQPYEIGGLLVKDHRLLSDTFSEKPEYLRDIEGNASEINFYDHGIQLTRRFRALKFYMSMKTFGLDAFKNAVQYSIELTEELEALLRMSSKWEIISPASLAVINFRYHPMDENYSETLLNALNEYISKKIVETQKAVLFTTILQEQVVLRMCLINPRTTMEDLTTTIEACERFAAEFPT